MTKKFMVTVHVTKIYNIPAQSNSSVKARDNAIKLIDALDDSESYLKKHQIQTQTTELPAEGEVRCSACTNHKEFLGFGANKHRCIHIGVECEGRLELIHGRIKKPKWCPLN